MPQACTFVSENIIGQYTAAAATDPLPSQSSMMMGLPRVPDKLAEMMQALFVPVLT